MGKPLVTTTDLDRSKHFIMFIEGEKPEGGLSDLHLCTDDVHDVLDASILEIKDGIVVFKSFCIEICTPYLSINLGYCYDPITLESLKQMFRDSGYLNINWIRYEKG